MAVVSETARTAYLQSFKWSISYSDGHVTTHKMLEFVNKRTGKDVIYKPTIRMMLTTISVFLLVCVIGVFVYTQLRSFWMKWQVWFGGVLVRHTVIQLIYIVCVSGVVYDVIHNGEAVIFAGGVTKS
jgi:oligosaccharyltransferase complex subunit gamma